MVNAAETAAAAVAVPVSVKQIGITSVWLVGQQEVEVLRVISNRSSGRGNSDIFGRL